MPSFTLTSMRILDINGRLIAEPRNGRWVYRRKDWRGDRWEPVPLPKPFKLNKKV